jgi:hypothetical protein
MSKTNHRVNKDRGERLGESTSHRHRRDFKVKANELIDLYDDPDNIDLIIEEDEEFVRYEKIKRTK